MKKEERKKKTDISGIRHGKGLLIRKSDGIEKWTDGMRTKGNYYLPY